jgi:hypothetical protein
MNHKPVITLCLRLLLLTISAGAVHAKGVYQTPLAFLQESFQGKAPPPSLIWLTPERKQIISGIMSRNYGGLRVRYWAREGRTAWILEEIGKELPITVGIVVEAGAIQRVKVLTFRESRGGEVRYPAFTDQFTGAGLNAKQQLDRHIDGISGATLSVRAVKKLTRLALYLHKQADDGNNKS